MPTVHPQTDKPHVDTIEGPRVGRLAGDKNIGTTPCPVSVYEGADIFVPHEFAEAIGLVPGARFHCSQEPTLNLPHLGVHLVFQATSFGAHFRVLLRPLGISPVLRALQGTA